MGVLRSYPSSNVSTMSHRVSQTRCQSASLPHHPAAGGFVDEEKTERGRTVGWEDGSECISFPPLSSTSTLSRGVTSYLRPGAVSLAAAMARGALSLSLWRSLAWLGSREDWGAWSTGLCSHGSRPGSVMDRDPQSPNGGESCARSATSLTWDSFRQA